MASAFAEGLTVGVLATVAGGLILYVIIRAIEWPGRAKKRRAFAETERAAKALAEDQALREFLIPLKTAWTFVAWVEEVSRDPKGNNMSPTAFTSHLVTMAKDLDSVWNRVAEKIANPELKKVFLSAARFSVAVGRWKKYDEVRQDRHDMAWHRVAQEMLDALDPVKETIGERLGEVRRWTAKPFGA